MGKINGAVTRDVLTIFASDILKLGVAMALLACVAAFFLARKWLEEWKLGEDAVLCVAVYPGHEEGRLEGLELIKYFESLSRFEYGITEIRMVNSPESPFFVLIETKEKK